MCYIYDDVEEADKWVRLEHTGEQNGVGIVEWKQTECRQPMSDTVRTNIVQA